MKWREVGVLKSKESCLEIEEIAQGVQERDGLDDERR